MALELFGYTCISGNIGLHFVADNMGLSSFKCVQDCSGLRKTHLFCNRVRLGRSRSSKVNDFGMNRKRACDFLLVRHCNYGPILHRFWDTYVWRLFITVYNLLPLYRSAPSLPLEFCGEEVNSEETTNIESGSYPTAKTRPSGRLAVRHAGGSVKMVEVRIMQFSPQVAPWL